MKYICPMHPEVVSDKPGMCSECGMNLVPIKNKDNNSEHAGHEKSVSAKAMKDKHAGHKTSSFLDKFWVAFVLTIPIFFYSEMASMIFAINAPKFWGYQYVFLVLGSIIFFYCGLIFLTSAYRELRAALPGMMTLIAIAITTAYLYSFFSIILGTGHDLLFELSSLITIMLLGHWIEMRAVKGAQGALGELAKLLPDTAEIIRNNTTEKIPISELKVGDIVLVKPGSKIPADGKIIDGHSELNESIITGESKPISKQIHDEVVAGSMNGDGALKVLVIKIGEGTFLAGIMRLVADAQASKSRLQMLSDRAAYYLTILAIISGGITFVSWLFAKAGLVFAIERLVAVLVIACPHALGLAIPLVASISTTMAARNGLLIKKRLSLEVARKINIVLFDKTGTLTKGEFGVDTIIPTNGNTEIDVIKFASSINSQSEHPLAKAIVNEAKKRGVIVGEVKQFERIPGKGAKGFIDGKEICIGSDSLLFEKKIVVDQRHLALVKKLSEQGKTINHIIIENKLMGSIALVDVIREESKEAIKALKKLGVKVAMITGDSQDVAQWVGKELELDEYFAKVLPQEKSEKVKLLQKKGLKVAMVGDGVNDAPALVQADLGIAIGAGTNVAIESAGIILVRNDPRDIVKIIRLSQMTYSKMIQNLFWATGYNVVALPLAAGALAFRGIILEPAVAAVLMSASTVIVAINAVLLRGRKL